MFQLFMNDCLNEFEFVSKIVSSEASVSKEWIFLEKGQRSHKAGM